MNYDRNKITEMFLNSSTDADSIRQNMLTKKLADLQLKKDKQQNRQQQLVDRHRQIMSKIDRDIERIRSQLAKL